MNRATAFVLAIGFLVGASACAGSYEQQASKLDDPAVLDEVIKAGEAAVPDLLVALKGPRADLAAQALGRIKSKQAVSGLTPLLKSEDGQLRAACAWAIAECGGDDAAKALLGLTGDPYAPARAAAIAGLGAFHSLEADDAIRRAVADKDEDVRLAAVQGIVSANRADLFAVLTPRLAYTIEMVPENQAKGAKPDPNAAPKLVEQVEWTEHSARVRLNVIRGLARMKVADALPALIEALEREVSFNRVALIKAVEGMGPGAAGVCLGRIVPMPYDVESFQKHMPVLINNGALAVIAGKMGDARSVPTLLETLKLPREGLGKDKDLTELYIESVELLGKFKCDRAGRPIAEILKSTGIRQLSEAAQHAIEAIGRPAARALARNMDVSLAPVFLKLLREPELRTSVARDGILEFLKDESDEVRLEATETLGLYLSEHLIDEYDQPALEAMYLDPNKDVRAACKRWMDVIAKKTNEETKP